MNDGDTPPYRTTVVQTDELESVEVDDLETAKWTRHLPEAFGIRDTIRQSNYRWCSRESWMWGIATGTGMSLHRLRMGSTTRFAINMGVATTLGVAGTSYYFCCKRRDFKEKMIETMMKMNAFEHASQMPAEPPLEEHPFAKPPGGNEEAGIAGRTFHGLLKEKKEWQPREESKDMKDVFKDEKPR